MAQKSIGVLHPGAMGASIVAALSGSSSGKSAQVFWCESERSEVTRERAAASGARACASLSELSQRCDLLLSVVLRNLQPRSPTRW